MTPLYKSTHFYCYTFLTAFFSFNDFILHLQQKWEAKAVEAKDKYTKLVKEYEANGGGKDSGKKRGSKQTRKAPSKKTKKQADSEDDDEEDESDQINYLT